MGDKRKISEMAAESEAIDRKGSRKSKKVARVEKEEKRDQKTRDQEASDTNDTVLQNGEVKEEGEKKEKEKTKKGKGRVHQSSTEDPEVANDQSTKNKKRKRDKKTKMDNIKEESHLVPEDPMQNIETITKPDETETMNKKDEKEKKLNESKRRSDVSKNEAKETADMYAETEKHKKIKTSKKENKQNEDRTISTFESDKEPDANADIQTTDTGCSEHEGLKDHVYSREPKDADDKNQNQSEYHDMNKRNIRFICFIGLFPPLSLSLLFCIPFLKINCKQAIFPILPISQPCKTISPKFHRLKFASLQSAMARNRVALHLLSSTTTIG